jgi:hypothetical protein
VRCSDDHTDVVAQHLTQHFIHLTPFALAPNRTADLRFEHRERGLDARPLVVVLHELFALVHEQIVNLRPYRIVLRLDVARREGGM